MLVKPSLKFSILKHSYLYMYAYLKQGGLTQGNAHYKCKTADSIAS